ncbi:MAG TPA: PAS domain-containing protein [Candidatus Limnocylindrales bacterium]|nr:PAS domain-containing protein [Candidatus Limnocylindrales bacterium]
MEVQVRKSALTALTFPPGDRIFTERVREVLDEASGGVDETIELLTERLAVVHPRVSIRVRSGLAGFGPGPVIYVFRDGTALPKGESEAWISRPDTALLVTDGDGTYIDATEPAAALFGVPREEILGKPAGTFTKPDARIEDADAVWRALREAGRLHSLAVVCRPDGTDVPVEFITIRDGVGAGRNLTLIRALV